MATTFRSAVAGLALAMLAVSTARADENGHLPQSELAPIFHPTAKVFLRKDAAAAWNAMRSFCLAHGVDIYPKGPNSAYRTYAQQVDMKRIYGSDAATP